MGIPKEMQEYINAAIRATVKAMERKARKNQAPSFYQMTVKLLASLRVLEKRVDDKKQLLREMEEHGVPERSHDLIRLGAKGPRMDREDRRSILAAELEKDIETDKRMIKTIKDALKQIEDDPYYITVYGKYVEGWSDQRIAEEIPCSLSTVYKNRPRLMDKLIVIFFGAKALRQN